MKSGKWMMITCIVLVFPILTSCGAKKSSKDKTNSSSTQSQTVSNPPVQSPAPPSSQLPVRYQNPGYLLGVEDKDIGFEGEAEEYQVKVGATIRSTGGPQPLWEVMKRLVNLKGMTVSWASDVDQTKLVDVDIAANDGFFDAIANLLRQADYFHEVNGKNVVVKNKATKVYQVGIPAMQGGYTSTVGGNFLSNKDAASGTEGSVKISSPDNKFNVWDNIETNLKTILKTAEAERKDDINLTQESKTDVGDGEKGTEKSPNKSKPVTSDNKLAKTNESSKQASPKINTARDGASFVIDKNIGLITVTAKPSLIKTVDNYINNIQKHLFRQVNIEAKIIEVYLQDNSKIGLDWSSVLKDFKISATTYFGNNGQVHPRTTTDPDQFSNEFVSRVEIPSLTFDVFLNALNEQGDTHVLANPKLTVLNGQPAIISVGKDVTYVKSVSREEDGETNDVTYTAEVGNVVQGIALGVMASILDNNKVVLHLTPITTDLENLTADGDIPMTSIGDGAISLGLPKVKVREMSTMVEVSDGEMLIIGGLIDSIEGKTGSFAPGLGSIPVVKYLFGVEEKTVQKRELVILLTPKII
jgi:general secretion pathway protein D/MSHA biogenesis protein MshL